MWHFSFVLLAFFLIYFLLLNTPPPLLNTLPPILNKPPPLLNTPPPILNTPPPILTFLKLFLLLLLLGCRK